MAERKFYFGRILAALAISLIIYIFIFSFAQWVSYLNYQSIAERNFVVQSSLCELEAVPENISCNNAPLVDLSESLDNLGASLALLEIRLGKDEPRVLEQKKLYSELEARHLNLVRELNKECNNSFLSVLFFYSNDKQSEKSSELAGSILTAFKRKQPGRIMIYSFDYNLDLDSIRELKKKYSVNETPFVMVNERDVIEKLKNIDQLDIYL
jgi:hypothetical protein